jgi:predicted transposase YdaD
MAIVVSPLSENEMDTCYQSVLDYRDVRQAVDYAKKEGQIEGRTEGVEQERVRIVKNCYLANISIETITSITGLTKEQVYDILTNGYSS